VEQGCSLTDERIDFAGPEAFFLTELGCLCVQASGFLEIM
jgi:hypothetical protein